MELVSLDSGRVIPLQEQTPTHLGRGPLSGITSLAVSRNHCSLALLPRFLQDLGAVGPVGDGRNGQEELDADVKLTVLHASGAAVIRGTYARGLGAEPHLLLLPANASCQLYRGDKVYLERRDARLASGFELRIAPVSSCLPPPTLDSRLAGGEGAHPQALTHINDPDDLRVQQHRHQRQASPAPIPQLALAPPDLCRHDGSPTGGHGAVATPPLAVSLDTWGTVPPSGAATITTAATTTATTTAGTPTAAITTTPGSSRHPDSPPRAAPVFVPVPATAALAEVEKAPKALRDATAAMPHEAFTAKRPRLRAPGAEPEAPTGPPAAWHLPRSQLSLQPLAAGDAGFAPEPTSPGFAPEPTSPGVPLTQPLVAAAAALLPPLRQSPVHPQHRAPLQQQPPPWPPPPLQQQEEQQRSPPPTLSPGPLRPPSLSRDGGAAAATGAVDGGSDAVLLLAHRARKRHRCSPGAAPRSEGELQVTAGPPCPATAAVVAPTALPPGLATTFAPLVAPQQEATALKGLESDAAPGGAPSRGQDICGNVPAPPPPALILPLTQALQPSPLPPTGAPSSAPASPHTWLGSLGVTASQEMSSEAGVSGLEAGVPAAGVPAAGVPAAGVPAAGVPAAEGVRLPGAGLPAAAAVAVERPASTAMRRETDAVLALNAAGASPLAEEAFPRLAAAVDAALPLASLGGASLGPAPATAPATAPTCEEPTTLPRVGALRQQPAAAPVPAAALEIPVPAATLEEYKPDEPRPPAATAPEAVTASEAATASEAVMATEVARASGLRQEPTASRGGVGGLTMGVRAGLPAEGLGSSPATVETAAEAGAVQPLGGRDLAVLAGAAPASPAVEAVALKRGALLGAAQATAMGGASASAGTAATVGARRTAGDTGPAAAAAVGVMAPVGPRRGAGVMTQAAGAVAQPAAEAEGGGATSSRGIFVGCRFVFWARALVRDILVRVKQAGGQEQYSVGPTTTHVIARYDTPAAEASHLLLASDLSYDTSSSGRPGGAFLPPGLLFVTPSYLRDSLARGQLLDPAGYQVALARQPPLPLPSSPQQQQLAQLEPAPSTPPLPSLSATFAAAVEATEAATTFDSETRTTRGRYEQASPDRAAPKDQPQQQGQQPLSTQQPEQPHPKPEQQQQGRDMVPLSQVPLSSGARAGLAKPDEATVPGSSGPVSPDPSKFCARSEDWGIGDRWIEPWSEEAARRTNMLILTHWAKHSYEADSGPASIGAARRGGAAGGRGSDGDGGGDGAAAGMLRGMRGRGRRYGSPGEGSAGGRLSPIAAAATAPPRGRDGGGGGGGGQRGVRPKDEEEWGTDEEESRRRDVSAGRDQRRCGGGSGATAAAAEGLQRQQRQQQHPPHHLHQHQQRDMVNEVCAHVCCSARPFCILAELRRTRDLYLGREDQFRIKALDRAMGVLVRLTWPLDTRQQLKQLHLGKGSEEKVAEILATGRFSRNDLYEHNEQRVAMMLFMQVWGCAESTARKWWAGGARTLADVRARTDLTAQQRLGLRHFEDFKRRIPREEVARVAATVRQATLEALRALTLLPDPDLLDRLHVRPMGSYSRGSTSSSDVDFIIAPSPQADPRVSPLELLRGLVERLKVAGYVDEASARMIETRHGFRSSTSRARTVRLLPPTQPTSPSNASHRPQSSGGSTSSGDATDSGDEHDEPVAVRPHPHEAAAAGAPDSCTWLGVWHTPSTGRFCRVDIKCYRRQLLPFAVNYFSSGADFNRALRYWCNVPVPHVVQLARRHHPDATAFRLSDKELAVVSQRSPEPGSGRREPAVQYVLATVPCSCETDIFRAVGLDYVPPHMRDITRVE